MQNLIGFMRRLKMRVTEVMRRNVTGGELVWGYRADALTRNRDILANNHYHSRVVVDI
jgi:hypothetical protein